MRDAGIRLVLTEQKRAARFQAAAPEDERAVVLVRELVVGVEPAVEPNVAPGADDRNLTGTVDAGRRGDGQEPADAHAGTICPQQKRADRDRGEAGDDQGERGHGGGW